MQMLTNRNESTNQEAKEIRKVSAPDMGLEPMTLRLKV